MVVKEARENLKERKKLVDGLKMLEIFSSEQYFLFHE